MTEPQRDAMTEPRRNDPIAIARATWEERWTDEAAVAMNAVTSVMRVQQILLARLNELLAPMELTFPRYEALMLLFLSRRGELPLGKMSDRLQVHRTSITNTIDGLERLELIARVRPEGDRRLVLARILPAGRAVAERATAVLNEASFATGSVGISELERLSTLLQAFRVDEGDVPSRT